MIIAAFSNRFFNYIQYGVSLEGTTRLKVVQVNQPEIVELSVVHLSVLDPGRTQFMSSSRVEMRRPINLHTQIMLRQVHIHTPYACPNLQSTLRVPQFDERLYLILIGAFELCPLLQLLW